MMTLFDDSQRVINTATALSDDAPMRWRNRVFEHEVWRQGYEIVPVPPEYTQNPGPALSPQPTDMAYRYPYPSAVAPRGWRARAFTVNTQPKKTTNHE